MKRICICILSLLLLCTLFSPMAFADTTYTNVLDDLQQDPTFIPSDFPRIGDDYSLKVIQIAESTDGELFVYVYQPSGKLKATSIHLAQVQEPNTADTHDYKLTLLNSAETLFKYKVEGIELKNVAVRYYDITSIFRAWEERYDKESGNGNIIGEVAYEVGQLWTVVDTSNGVEYSMRGIETIEILNPYVDTVRYSDGFGVFYTEWCDSHYVAFSTDKRMDDLLEASVYFESREVNVVIIPFYGDWISNEVLLKKDEVVENDKGRFRLFCEDYQFSRIVRTNDFVATEDLDNKAEKGVEGTEWVLRFVETSYSASGVGTGLRHDYTEVANVTILRLKFETDGKVYNMGTVMNKITMPPVAGLNLPWWVWLIIALVVFGLIGLFVRPVATIIVWGVKLVIWLLSLPFKFVRWLFGRGKK